MADPTFITPIRAELARMEECIRDGGEEDFPWLGAILGHVLGTKGKHIRPAITLLTGHLYTYDASRHVPMAGAVELLHLASLVHDDTVDKAALRRGHPTVNAQWGDHIAVLLGDYLFAKSAELVASTGSIRVVGLFAETLRLLASGELRELHAAFNWDLGQQFYWQRVARKTASLFSRAAQTGAILGGAPERDIATLHDFGASLGLAFQVVDDILDFKGLEQEVGKPVGNDLAQGVLTLPAILYLERYANGRSPQHDASLWTDAEEVARLIEQVRESPAIEESYRTVEAYCQRARDSLRDVPDGQYRRALLDIVDYVAVRTA